MGENIGAVARAMGNFGLSELRIVTPRDGWPNPAAIAMAAHAKPVIEQAKLFDSVEAAIADCHYVVAATARQRDMQKPHLTPKSWCDQPKPERTALLLGRENNGLSNEEITLADAIVTIPVDSACPSINLAQSAAVLCYEWYQSSGQNLDYEKTAPATKQELQHFFQQLESSLDEENFWKVVEKKEKMWQNLRNLFTRAEASSQEVQSLQGMLKAISRKTTTPGA
jgi:tRNA/rRNA methyltransferase